MGNFSLYKLEELHDISCNSADISTLEHALSEVLVEKTIFDEFSDYYIELCILECKLRYKVVQLGNNPIEKTREYLTKAYMCTKLIRLCCIELDYSKTSIIYINTCHQQAIILYELYMFCKDPIKHLKKAITLLHHVQNNTDEDSKLNHLAILNESNCLLELARNGIEPQLNCIKAMELAEISKNNFHINDSEYNGLLINQYDAIVLLIENESYGFGVEFFPILKQLVKKFEIDSLITSYLNIGLVNMGLKNSSILNQDLNEVLTIKEKLSSDDKYYHEYIVLEGELLTQIAEYEDDSNKILILLKCISIFEDYRDDFSFDYYYTAKTLFKEAKVRLKLSQLNFKVEDNLKIAKSLLLNAKQFYENVPFQNQDRNCPQILLILAQCEKKLSLIENTLSDKSSDIETYLIKSLDYFEMHNNKEKILDCYFELGDLFFTIKNYKKSYEYLNDALNLVELMRSSISDFNIKKKLFEKTTKLFKIMIQTCYYLGRYGEALKFVEMSKHRVFLDKIVENQQNTFVKSVDSEIINELHNVEEIIDLILLKMKTFDENGFSFSSEYKKLLKLKKLQKYYLTKIKNDFYEYYDYYYNNFFDYTKLDLKDKTIIEYYYADDFLLIFLISDKKISVEKVDFKTENLLNIIKDFKSKIDKTIEIDNKKDEVNLEEDDKEEILRKLNWEYGLMINEIEKIMENLYEILIKPIYGKNHKKLVIIPYKELHNIPFNCLKHDKKYLIDDHLITIVQSGSSIKYLINNSFNGDKKDCLVIGNTINDLPDSEEEALFVSDILKTEPLIYENATKGKILESINGKHIIHFAGHANFNIQNPLRSYLKLADEPLYLNEINDYDIGSELIVLSACESGMVSVDEFDEADSFISYLQINGVKYIIASLWPVYSKHSKDLFKNFYRLDGTYGERLRESQLILKKTSNILEWGPFQIYGI